MPKLLIPPPFNEEIEPEPEYCRVVCLGLSDRYNKHYEKVCDELEVAMVQNNNQEHIDELTKHIADLAEIALDFLAIAAETLNDSLN